MKHYRLIVKMKSRPQWEMPLGTYQSSWSAMMRALLIAEELGWAQITIGNSEGYFCVHNYQGKSQYFDWPMDAVKYAYATAPDFTEVTEVIVTEGEAAQPNRR